MLPNKIIIIIIVRIITITAICQPYHSFHLFSTKIIIMVDVKSIHHDNSCVSENNRPVWGFFFFKYCRIIYWVNNLPYRIFYLLDKFEAFSNSADTFTGSIICPIEFVIFQISLRLFLRIPSASIFTREGAVDGIFQFGNQHTEHLYHLQKLYTLVIFGEVWQL